MDIDTHICVCVCMCARFFFKKKLCSSHGYGADVLCSCFGDHVRVVSTNKSGSSVQKQRYCLKSPTPNSYCITLVLTSMNIRTEILNVRQ